MRNALLLRSLGVILSLTACAAPAKAAVFYPTSFTLANGLQVVVVPNHLSPTVTQMVWYKVGSGDELPGKHGLAHYLEHLMFRGTSTMAPGEFSKTIAAQGGEDNAFTSYDFTAYHETVAADRMPLIMQMEADRMRNLQITPETAAPELSVVLDERQQRTDNNPEGRFIEKLRNLLSPDHPYGVPVIGWKKEVEKLTTEDAKAFYKSHYAPNNAIVVISGDVEPSEVMKLATTIYGAVPKTDIAPRRPMQLSPEPTQHKFTMVDAGVEQAQIELATMVPSRTTQKNTESYAYEVLAEALDGGEIGPLYQSLVVQKKSASGVGTDYDADTRGDAQFIIALTPQPGKSAEQLEKDLAAELKSLAEKTLSEDSIAKAKKRLIRSAIFARDGIMGPGYVFGTVLTTGGTVNDVEEWPSRIKAVTTAQVNKALRDLIANKHNITGILLPDEKASDAAREAARPPLSHDMGIR